MPTDTTEKGLETLIMRHMTGVDGSFSDPDMIGESAPNADGNGWFAGRARAYDREFAVDVAQLFAFLKTTQPDETAKLGSRRRGHSTLHMFRHSLTRGTPFGDTH